MTGKGLYMFTVCVMLFLRIFEQPLDESMYAEPMNVVGQTPSHFRMQSRSVCPLATLIPLHLRDKPMWDVQPKLWRKITWHHIPGSSSPALTFPYFTVQWE